MKGRQERSLAIRVFRNFSYLTIGRIVGDTVTFVLFVVITRTYGQEGIGQYSFAMAFTGFFAVVADFGLSHLSIKEISRADSPLGVYLGRLLFSRLLLTLFVFATLFTITYALDLPAELRQVILVIGVYQIVYTLFDGQVAILIARENMRAAAILDSSLKILIGIVGITIALAGGSLTTLVVTFPVMTLLYAAGTLAIISKNYTAPIFPVSLKDAFCLMRESVPYALMQFLNQLSTRIDVVLLGFLLTITASGIFNAAYRIVSILLVITNFASMALFPIMSRMYLESKQQLATLYDRALSIAVLIFFPIAVGLCLIAPTLINLIYGKQFEDSILLLQLLAWLIPIICMHNIIGTVLTASDKQSQRTRCQCITSAANVIGNAVLIPAIGIKGAAIATLLSEALLVLLLARQVKRFIGWPRIGHRIAISIFGSVAFSIPLIFFDSLTLIILIPASMIIYITAISLSSEIRDNELRQFIAFLKD